MSHYKFVNKKSHPDFGDNTYRIVATRDIPSVGVKKGDIGGWVSTSATLGEDCWVFDDAVLCDYAQVLNHSVLRHEALVCDKSVVTDNSSVIDEATVYHSGRVENWSEIKLYASVRGNAVVSNGSTMSGYANVSHFAQVLDSSTVTGYSKVRDNAVIAGATIDGNSIISNNAWVHNMFVINTKVDGDRVMTSTAR